MSSTAAVTIVTGAGSGIGRAIAARLGKEGHRLALVGRREAPLHETAADVDDALVAPADLADPGAAAAVVELVVERWGRLDVIVNNAGVADPAPIDATTTERLRGVFEINTHAPARLIAAAWATFVAQRAGCVVNVTSMAVVDPFPGLSIYAASKAALDSFTRSVHIEGAEHGIRAYSIAPGAVETAMLRTVVTEDELPGDQTLDPAEIADRLAACIAGSVASGSSMLVPNPG